MSGQCSSGEDLARRVNRIIRATIEGDHIAVVAEKTGLDLDRVAEIVGGDLPDSFELIMFERGYHRSIWPSPSGK